jgi:predicted nuclease of restriction endonuclease-like (RecB) superfamily
MSDIQIHTEKVLSAIRELIENSRHRVVIKINTELTMLYWNIGKHIQQSILKAERAEYGEQILPTLSAKLMNEYGKGFSERSLARMIKFYGYFPDKQILSTLLAKLSWSHFIELLGVKDGLQREFYYTLSVNEHWSVRQLKERINSMLYERSALSKQPELTVKKDLEKLRKGKGMSIPLALKDTYILDFLGLKDTYSERDLESAIIANLQQFILELGNDFAFLARQKRVTIDTEDYYLDLLFFHRKLNRLVAIDLKLGNFEHSHKSQMELYLRWLAKYEMQPHEHTPIGLIFCADKSEELIQLLEMDKQGMHVAAYYTELPSVEWMQLKLKQAIADAKQLLDNKSEPIIENHPANKALSNSQE